MKKLIILANVLLMTGCLHAPPEAYEVYHRHHTNDEQTKEDMKACGFPDVRNTDHYFVHYENDYVISSLCMEQKGCRDKAIRGRGGICSANLLKNTEAYRTP
ncbi:hypothetical protein MOVS_01485 [Moraxella ovis]|uniref:Lipoprotein n=1 Tax=Moraxella ovis TaxID=29433 RepID=A0A161I8E6_9GAMM|nr:hypothetical protein [Moraxella ovis]ANB90884.1 hypothetical protein MOVS_01485 [Moraxella ovis]SPX85319.1 Uncharacterised protein [Moraxella ovis]STY86329.1 Uncharacterised protein [Moraxella ovis]STZ06377.1 Uncharacterised protein [Moraxella ovis]